MKSKPDLNKLFVIFLALVMVLVSSFSYGQRKKKKSLHKRKGFRGDAIFIKPTKIKNKKGKSGRGRFRGSGGRDFVEKEGLLAERYVDRTPIDNPELFSTLQRPNNLLREDTFSLFDGEPTIVEVAEEIQIDSSWIKATEYYSIWDAYSLNPYRSDVTQLKENLNLVLFDTTKGQTWSEPVPNSFLTSIFGKRGYRWHYGVDLELDMGDSIKSVWDGVVRLTNWDGGGYGNYVLVRHYNGFETLYGHLSDIQCTVGQIVQAGDLLAKGGSTGRSSGPHLHFEIRYQGIPINPMEIFDFNGHNIKGSSFTLTPETFDYLDRRIGRRAGESSGRTRKVFYHKVRRGDTLSEISEKYGVSLSTLRKLNGISRNFTLQPGKRIRIR